MRHVYTSWSGTGSVPASGTGTNVTFTILENSTLTWNWRTDNVISVSVANGGTCSFGTQWIENGTTATAEIVPSTHLYAISLAGNTNGVALAGTTLTIPSDRPRDIIVTIEEVKLALDVVTAHGTATPAAGRTSWSWGDTVSASVTDDEPIAGVRFVCTGWTGTGSVPASGTGTNAVFAIKQDSTLTWNCQKQNQIAVSVAGCGDCTFGTQWISDGTAVTAEIVPTTHLYTIAMSGDTNGVTLAGTTLSIPSDQPREIAVTVTEVKLPLEVATAHGTATPAAGRTSWSWGDTVSASVTDDEPVGGVRFVCTGWTGTGSVPASGTGTNAVFAIKQDSTLTWNWQKQNQIVVSVAGCGECSFGTQWVADGTTVTTEIVPTTHLYTIAISGDTNGVTLAGTTLSIPSDQPREIAVTVTEVLVALDVATEHGTPSPSGRTEWSWGDAVAARVAADEPVDGVRFLCTGWTGTGSAPKSGSGTNCMFTIKEPSSITWKWKEQVLVEFDKIDDSDGVHVRSRSWSQMGGTAVFGFEIPPDGFVLSLDGDTSGVVIDLDAGWIRIPADAPRTVCLTIHRISVDQAILVGKTRPVWGEMGWSLNGRSQNGQWCIAKDATAAGGYCLRSGETGAGETSAFEATVEGSGVLSFDWRISSSRGHYAKFFVDGMETNSITRSTQWATVTHGLKDGTHTLRWTYEKGTGATAGEDAAFLDNVRWTPLTLEVALDATNLVWTTDGGAGWIPQLSVSSDGTDAAKSGAVVGESVSRLSTVVTNAGTLAWKWKAEVAGAAGVDVWLDGEYLYDEGVFLEGSSDWTDVSLEIEGNGEHVVVFEFWNSGTEATISDCAYIDCVSWTPPKPAVVVVDGVEVPVSWLDEAAGVVVTAVGGDYKVAALATAANGVNKVWECYVAGLSPTNAAARFEARVEFENGAPVVTWSPDLGAARNYVVEGKETLGDGWGPTNTASRFFRVKVSLPE